MEFLCNFKVSKLEAYTWLFAVVAVVNGKQQS